MLLAVHAFHYFFTSDPDVRRANTPGAVCRSATENREVSHDLVVVEWQTRFGIFSDAFTTHFELGITAACG